MRKPIGKIKNESLKKEVRRKLSIRKKISGTASIPRVCVKKTNKNLSVQVIDDLAGKTLVSAQTFGKNAVGTTANKESAKALGVKVAELMKGASLETAVFDRNGKKYTGVVAEVATAIRENGIRI
jgi:large subunit ribosomal protein L18